MTAHTPGPWRAVFDTDEYGAEVETESRGFCEGSQGICNCRPEDALLIAAAPELADALRAVAEFWAGGDAPQELTNQINAALAKAGL